MNPLVVLVSFYLLSIILGKLTIKPGYRTIIVIVLLTITEVGLVLLYLFEMKPPKAH